MATTDIEKLVVQLSADVRGYQKSLDRVRGATNRTARDVESRFNKMNSKINSSFKDFGKGLIGGFIGGFAVEGIVDKIGEVIHSLAEVHDAAIKAGTSAEELQALGFVAKQDGVEIETLTKGLAKLNQKVGEARTKGKGPLVDIFAANSLQFSDNVIENFKKVAELIKNAKNEQDKATIGAAAFGKSYADLLPLLNKGAAAIGAGEQKARDLGIVIDEELVNKADDFDDKWTEIWDRFKSLGTLSVVSVASALSDLANSPALRALLDFIEKFNAGSILVSQTLSGKNPLFNLSLGGETVIGGNALDEAKQKVTALQAQLDHLIADPNAPAASIEATKKALDEAIAKAAQLQKALDLSLIKQGGFGFPSATGRQGLGGIVPAPSTVVPSAELDTTDLEKVIDKLANAIVDFESKGNITAKNPLSSATGLGQFIESTWIKLFKENFPDRAKNLSDAAILALRNDAATSVALIKQYARDNALILQKAGVAVTQANLQLAHFLGPQGALAVLKAPPGTPVEQVLPKNVIAANQGVLAGRTTDQVIAEANARAGLSGAIRDNNEQYAKEQDIIRKLLVAGDDEAAKLRLENSLYGDTSLAAEKLRVEYEKLTEAKNELGRKLTPDERKVIIANADAIAEQNFQTQQLAEGQKAAAASAAELAQEQEQLNQTMEEVSGAFKDSLKGFIQDLIQGKSLTEALNNALTGLGEKLLDIALNNLFSGLGGGAGGGAGGLLSGLFHQGGVVGAGGSGRFVSPSVFAGAKRYHAGGLPGLMPGEVAAILKKGEIVLPNMDALKSIAQRRSGASGGTAIIQNNTFTAPDIRTLSRSGNQLSRSAAVNLERVRRVT